MYRQQPILPREDKTLNQKNTLILKKLTRIPENKDCADCKNKNVARWASVNLGVFICIRCSGIHRNMGVHISRVKSVDLDSWTPEQVETVRRWGNRRANIYWEAALQQGHKPSDDKIESFIRTKYERKRWTKIDEIPDPETLGPVSDLQTDDQQPSPSTPVSRTSKPLPGLVKTNNDLLGEFDTSSTSSRPNANASGSSPAQVPPKSAPAPVQKSSTNSSNDSGGLLALDFSSSPSNQLASSTSSNNNSQKKNTNADIMSLFSSLPPKPGSTVSNPQLSPDFFAAPQSSSSAPPTSTTSSNLIPDLFSSSATGQSFPQQQNAFNSSTVFPAPTAKSAAPLVSDFSGLSLSSSSSPNNSTTASGLPSFDGSFTSPGKNSTAINPSQLHKSTPSYGQAKSASNPWSSNTTNAFNQVPSTTSFPSSPPRNRPSIGSNNDILGSGMNPWSANNQPTTKITSSNVTSNTNVAASAAASDDAFGDWSSFEAAPPISNSAFGTSSFTATSNPTNVNVADVFANVWSK